MANNNRIHPSSWYTVYFVDGGRTVMKGREIKGLSGGVDFTAIELPVDYEPCGHCGYDHQYEYSEARRIHQLTGA